MLRFMLTMALLTHGLGFVASAASQNCVDVEVRGNNSRPLKRFISRGGRMLFFPSQDFEGVSITLVAAGKKSTHQVTRRDLCVNSSSEWYSLDVKVHPKSTYHQCIFETDYCSGKCGLVNDLWADNFQSFDVEVHGESFWSLRNTGRQKALCTTPAAANTKPAAANDKPAALQTTSAAANKPAIAHTTPTATNKPAVANTKPPATNKPAVANTKPSATNKPAVANTKPAIANDTPAAAHTKPPAANTKPATTNTPAVAHTKPTVANTKPAAAKTHAVAHTKPTVINTPAVVHTAPTAATSHNTSSDAEASTLWVVGVIAGAVVLAAVILVTCIAILRSRTRETQQEMQISVPICPHPRGYNNQGMETSPKYDPTRTIKPSNPARLPSPDSDSQHGNNNPAYEYLHVI